MQCRRGLSPYPETCIRVASNLRRMYAFANQKLESSFDRLGVFCVLDDLGCQRSLLSHAHLRSKSSCWLPAGGRAGSRFFHHWQAR